MLVIRLTVHANGLRAARLDAVAVEAGIELLVGQSRRLRQERRLAAVGLVLDGMAAQTAPLAPAATTAAALAPAGLRPLERVAAAGVRFGVDPVAVDLALLALLARPLI